MKELNISVTKFFTQGQYVVINWMIANSVTDMTDFGTISGIGLLRFYIVALFREVYLDYFLHGR